MTWLSDFAMSWEFCGGLNDDWSSSSSDESVIESLTYSERNFREYSGSSSFSSESTMSSGTWSRQVCSALLSSFNALIKADSLCYRWYSSYWSPCVPPVSFSCSFRFNWTLPRLNLRSCLVPCFKCLNSDCRLCRTPAASEYKSSTLRYCLSYLPCHSFRSSSSWSFFRSNSSQRRRSSAASSVGMTATELPLLFKREAKLCSDNSKAVVSSLLPPCA